MLHLTNHARQFRAFLNLRLRESENALSKVFDTPELGFTVVWDYEGDRVTVSVKAADVGLRVKKRLIQLGHAISAVARSQCGDCGVKHYGAPHQCTASKMTDSEKIQNRADLLQAFADEPEGLVAHHDLFAGENLSNGTDEDDPSPLATVQADKFLREVELTTGYHLDDRKHYVLELSALGEERGPMTLGRYAVDAGFMAAANRRIVIGAPNSLVREALTDYLDVAAQLVLKDARDQTWFDVSSALSMYFDLAKNLSTHGEDVDKTHHRLLRKMLAKVLTKQRPAMPELRDLLSLREVFPNLAEPITFIAQHLAVRKASSKQGFSIPPILLVGPPGIGKTYLAYELSKVIGAYPKTINMASLTHGMVIAGTSKQWGNSSPGIVFKTLLEAGSNRAPIIVLDEVDKADGFHSALAPLYHLLDPVMAPRFTDEFMAIEIDTSSITWIATANEKSTIAEPILDRFVVFDCPQPNRDQLDVIVANIYRGIAKDIPYLPKDIPAAWLQSFGNVSLRQVTAEIEKEIGRLALHREMNPGSEIDLSAAMRPVQQRKRMGF
jgi:hypothetical protein